MPKEVKKKKTKQIKQKQNISIVINSNNRSKKTVAPKQLPPPQAPTRNNPPVYNIMGETRPQVSASGNFSGLGQQNRIFATDSELEQRLARLLKFENDQSANPTPPASNSKILAPSRKASPSPPRLRAPPKSEVMDLNYFNARKKAYEDEQATIKAQKDDEVIKTPTVVEAVKTKFNNFFSPKYNTLPAAGSTLTPEPIQRLGQIENLGFDNINLQQDEKEDQSALNEEYEPIVPAGRKQWMKLKLAYKKDWAYDNQGIGSDMVQLNDDDIDILRVREINAIYDQVMDARAKLATRRI